MGPLRTTSIRLLCTLAAAGVTLTYAPQVVHAACDTTGIDTAWGNFKVVRQSGSCNCDVVATEYGCVKSSGVHPIIGTSVIATVTGSCDTPCEASSGYDTAMATMRAKYEVGDGKYECDTEAKDEDGDGWLFCLDEDDRDPRIWVKESATESVCDNVDNDSDGTADDTLGTCSKDYKRLTQPNLFQGNSLGRINLVDGAYHRSEQDVTIDGPYSALSFRRNYNSRRPTNDAALGTAWTHSFAVYLKQMPSGDDRWQVQTRSGEMQYFRCQAYGANMGCVVDDHTIAGNLRRVDSVFFYHPGDGTRYSWTDTTTDWATQRRLYTQHTDEAGYVISTATADSSERITKAESANTSIYLEFHYDANGYMDEIRIGGSANKVVGFEVNNTTGMLDKVKYSSTLGTISSDIYTRYTYSGDNLTGVYQDIDASTAELRLAENTFDATTDRVTAMKDPTKDFSIAYQASPPETQITFNVNASGNETVEFAHFGLWVVSRDLPTRMGGMRAKKQVYNDHGQVTCAEFDGTGMKKWTYASSVPTEIAEYGKSDTCTTASPTLDHKEWLKFELNTTLQAWRPVWMRERSVYGSTSSTDCSTSSLPSDCTEVKYEYASSTDSRIKKVITTGTTRLVTASTSQQVREDRFSYFTLDSGDCTSSDSYAGKLCRVKRTNSSGTGYSQTEYTYVASGSTAGLPKTVKHYKSSTDSHTTTFGAHNLFGSPTTITAPSGVVTTIVYNGWNAVTSSTDDNALIDDSGGYLDLETEYSYNWLRRVDTVTLPKDNKIQYKYYTGSGEFARTKAWATVDTNLAQLEIMRYDYDAFGNLTGTKIIDSISNSRTEDETQNFESRTSRKYNGLRRVLEEYLYASSATSHDDTKTNTYANGQIIQVSDYLGIATTTSYDSQGRVSLVERDDGTGYLNAGTAYTYDIHGRVATVAAPNGVATPSDGDDYVTTFEYDDFGQLVLERSRTRGDIRFEYDPAGRTTKRRRSSYNSTSNQQDDCYTADWLGRQTEVDYDCNSSANANLYYDGDSLPSSACATGTVQTGRLSGIKHPTSQERVICYHPNGMVYSSFQQTDGATWSNTTAKGTTRVYDKNGNVSKIYLWDRPNGHTYAREVEYVYSTTLPDRVDHVKHKLVSAGSWTYVTSNTTAPTYAPFGGFKTLLYGNGVEESMTWDKANRTKTVRTAYSTTKMTDLELAYDNGGNITEYDDSEGYRHLQYFASYDRLYRLRCVSRAAITATDCEDTDVNPWASSFIETFDYDLSGNRTHRKYGAFDSVDEDAYAYISESDIIDKVTSGGNDKQMANEFKGGITEVNQVGGVDENVQYTYHEDGWIKASSDSAFLDQVVHSAATPFFDRYMKTSVCNARKTYYYYAPTGPGGASHQLELLDTFHTCATHFPRHYRFYIYLEGRPIAMVTSDRTSESSDQLSNDATYWLHTDQLGTPILVSDNSHIEKWRWENDPFGLADPVEYALTAVDPTDHSSANPYNTCCCDTCCSYPTCQSCTPSGTCGGSTSTCCTGCCAGGQSQGVISSETYTVAPNPSGRTVRAIRLHFSAFNVAAGTTKKGKDFVTLYKSDGTTEAAVLTGNLGAFWGPWVTQVDPTSTTDAQIVLKLTADNVADGTAGYTVDKYEYTTDADSGDTERFIVDLRYRGQIWDEDAEAAHNYHRWYRREDGRYLQPDPIGLHGGEPGYFAYVNSSPLSATDAEGLHHTMCDACHVDAPGSCTSGSVPSTACWCCYWVKCGVISFGHPGQTEADVRAALDRDCGPREANGTLDQPPPEPTPERNPQRPPPPPEEPDTSLRARFRPPPFIFEWGIDCEPKRLACEVCCFRTYQPSSLSSINYNRCSQNCTIQYHFCRAGVEGILPTTKKSIANCWGFTGQAH